MTGRSFLAGSIHTTASNTIFYVQSEFPLYDTACTCTTLVRAVTMRSTVASLLLACPLTNALQARQNAAEHSICRFSPQFAQDEILRDSKDFESNIFYWEGQFHHDGIGYRSITGITIGHTALGYATGLPTSRMPDMTESRARNEVWSVSLSSQASS